MKRYLIILLISPFFCFSQTNTIDKKGLRQGVWAKYYPDNKTPIYTGQFLDNKPIGEFRYFFPSGKVKAIIQHQAKNNLSYARLYFNGNVLNPHLDRPYCEVSLTIQLAKSHDYVWPIHLEDARYDLEIGDAVLYLGCEKTHWRDKCEGPEGYYSGQLFLHYIKANGQNKQFAGEGEIPFVRDRIKQVMENKNET